MVKKKSRRDPAKESAWRGRLAAWRKSGLGVREFCRREKLSEQQFYAWRRELKFRDRESPRPVRFAAVELKPSVPVSESAASRDAMEVILPDERCVRVRAGFNPQALARVLAVLERSAC